jgi:hypothetical protein
MIEQIRVTLRASYVYNVDALHNQLLEDGMTDIQPSDVKELAVALAYDRLEIEDTSSEVTYLSYGDVNHEEQNTNEEITKTMNKYGTIFYELNDLFHRTDGPAIIYTDGTKKWYKNGFLHRIDGPAVEYADGGEIWYADNRLHREDGPAAKFANGEKYWYKKGIQYSKDFKTIL